MQRRVSESGQPGRHSHGGNVQQSENMREKSELGLVGVPGRSQRSVLFTQCIIAILVALIAAICLSDHQVQAENRNHDPEEGLVISKHDRNRDASQTSPASTSGSSGHSHSTIASHKDRQVSDPANGHRYFIEKSTKVINVNSSNEFGVLWAVLNSGGSQSALGTTHQNKTRPAEESSKNSTTKLNLTESDGNNGANFSVFLISGHKDHFAIVIDVESVDFEPVINCEYQELRFSIVGEISKQLLERRNNLNIPSNSSEPQSSGDPSSPPNQQAGDEPKEDEDEGEESSSRADAGGQPPLSVSEAMALIMNAPLNKTILDKSDDTNEFRLIDTTIDYLKEETCRQLRQQHPPSSSRSNRTDLHQQQEQSKPRLSGRSRGRHRNRSRRRKGKPTQAINECDHKEPAFQELFATMLDEHLEWDDFKFVCGKVRQLIIPMRSLKLSISSDEFSPRSSFSIRYRFISDPKDLPTRDNGKYYCRNRQVIDLSLKCDGHDDCGDASDESIKICGYPTGRLFNRKDAQALRAKSSQPNRNSTTQIPSRSSDGPTKRRHDSIDSLNSSSPRRKLTYFPGDVPNCCQSSDWLPKQSPIQPASHNLQTLIGESMKLFSEPLFAPTNSLPGPPGKLLKRIKRIVGGKTAQKGFWPAQASLQYEILEPLSHFCAGTLIHPQYVLTAGHCITRDGLARGIKVVFGAHDLRHLNESHIQERYVDDAQVYPGVNMKQSSADWENDMNNDIALLRLNAPVSVTQHVAPACLPPFYTPLDVNTTCHSIGWGQTHGSGSSNLLKHLPLRVVNSLECSSKLIDRDGDQETDPKANENHKPKESSSSRRVSWFESSTLDTYNNLTMICVNNDQGHGICQGDSGGPLYCERTTPTGELCKEVYGVASFIIQYATVGAMCAVENLPGIFGEVSSKTEWISSTIKMFEQTYRLKYAQGKQVA